MSEEEYINLISLSVKNVYLIVNKCIIVFTELKKMDEDLINECIKYEQHYKHTIICINDEIQNLHNILMCDKNDYNIRHNVKKKHHIAIINKIFNKYLLNKLRMTEKAFVINGMDIIDAPIIKTDETPSFRHILRRLTNFIKK